MKHIAIILSIAFSLFAFAKADAQKSNQRDQYKVQVDGLGCPFCAYGLEKKFKEFKGIKDVKIDIETGDFSFSYPSDKALTMDAVVSQVEKAGYTPKLATITRANGKVETNASNSAAIASTDVTMTKMYVNGKCGMCKARIEKAATSLAGVSTAEWDEKTKMLTISHNPSKTNKEAVASNMAKVGHDTKIAKSSDATYDALPACCHYKRAI
ncbi:Copper chaperone CopZ [Nonlabens sp. Hel1_33_55]|uniref:heavy-metal-associated domain-containing protein n=1 Tax=Nonlabens sp. Hel1_33_55 TaxID=1336802 RepID=UPI000875E4EB|nr:cation transporter [Nonlabens sp. Hel1_33_55]SCX88330.1 Copper chaperone CopZ [Nonlabens sp. Hel1_33_55]